VSKNSQYVAFLVKSLLNGESLTRVKLEGIATKQYGIADKTVIKELTELAIVNAARSISNSKKTIPDKFEEIVSLYSRQANISFRTSQSMLLQQYSTPAPIGYLAGLYCYKEKVSQIKDFGSVELKPIGTLFEPSAGNGLLTIAWPPEKVIVNELDPIRRANLETQDYMRVLDLDATEDFETGKQGMLFSNIQFDAVITNPPFGRLDMDKYVDGFKIKDLDHWMAINALSQMKDSGKAAIIVGGHTEYDEDGFVKSGKNRIFINYLTDHYHVEDLINIDGHKLYSKQGTSYDVRLILINGRKTTKEKFVPLVATDDMKTVVTDWNTLFDRVTGHLNFEQKQSPELRQLSETVSAYGWNAKKEDGQIHLYNRKGNKVVLVLINGTKYAFLDTSGNRLMSGSGQLQKSVSGLLEDYYFAKKETPTPQTNTTMLKLKLRAKALKAKLKLQTLEGPYFPTSDSCVTLDTHTPDSMDFEIHQAMARIKAKVGPIDEYVRKKLHYDSDIALCRALAAEQIDVVAAAIYNIEEKKQGVINGDQTGIGKGRTAAAMVRYGVLNGYTPIFITEKPNLFTDLYRDLIDINSDSFVPFIVNARDSKTTITDKDGNKLHNAPDAAEQNRAFDDGNLPSKYDFVMCTYSQFSGFATRDKQGLNIDWENAKSKKIRFLRSMAANKGLIIMDESHNASGSSKTGRVFQEILKQAAGAYFLSATFAKRPDNMPIYAQKTSISDANLSSTELVAAITKGGVALQEILAAQLVDEGQMIRRERTFEGIEVNYLTMTDKELEHIAIADNVTRIIRNVIDFQRNYIDPTIEGMDKQARKEGNEVYGKGNHDAGVDNPPAFSRVFNIVNMLLFSLKAEAIAERAIARLKEGKKPVIAFANTMESFLKDMELEIGDTVDLDFNAVLEKALYTVRKYNKKNHKGESEKMMIEVEELSQEAQLVHAQIMSEIRSASTGISISPIDVIINKIEKAGFSVQEVTGRQWQLDIEPKSNTGTLKNKKKVPVNEAFRQFNNNEVDVLMINQSGSTGASAHAIVTKKVPKEQVKQRVMIILQAELNINTEVQKRGRVNRTGQIMKPIYDYMTSVIPAEQRLMMMLQKKLKSLDANTTSNQKQSNKVLDVPDFLNKYGDMVVEDYINENPALIDQLGIKMGEESEDGGTANENLAHKVSGRVAILSVKEQSEFYSEIFERYNKKVEILRQSGDYDLEVEYMDLQAETKSREVKVIGKSSKSVFGDSTYLDVVEANQLKKPWKRDELMLQLKQRLSIDDKVYTPQQLQSMIIEQYEDWWAAKNKEERDEINESYQKKVANAKSEEMAQKYEKEWEVAATKQKMRMEESYEFLMKLFRFFYIGRGIKFPLRKDYSVMAVFMGVVVNRSKKNPYAPSSLDFQFALADSNKYISIPASGEYGNMLTSAIGRSYDLKNNIDPNQMLDGLGKLVIQKRDNKIAIQAPYNSSFVNSIKEIPGRQWNRYSMAWIVDKEYEQSVDYLVKKYFPYEEVETTDLNAASRSIIDQWDDLTKSQQADRVTRKIVTGNILQGLAWSQYKGTLTSYTTKDGAVKKGILMPEDWEDKDAAKGVSVPFYMALPILQATPYGQSMTTSDGRVSLFHRFDGNWQMIAPGSASAGGDIFLDQELLKLVGNFEKMGDKMRTTFPDTILKQVAAAMGAKGFSLPLTREQYDRIKDTLPIRGEKEIFDIPKKRMVEKVEPVPNTESPKPNSNLKLKLKLRAKALKVKLMLQNEPVRMIAGVNESEELFHGYAWLKKTETNYLLTGKTRIDKDYDPEDAEYQQREVLIPSYVVHEDDSNGVQFDNVDDAWDELNDPPYLDNMKIYEDNSKYLRLDFKIGWIDGDNYLIDEEKELLGDEIRNYDDVLAKSPFDAKTLYGDNIIESVSFGKREDGAEDLLSKAQSDLGLNIIKKYEGMDIEVHGWRRFANKYSTIEVSKGDEHIGSIKLRIADHTYNPANNNMQYGRYEDFISVEIANFNATEKRWHGGKSLKYNKDSDYDTILEDVNERIKEIIDGWV